jgi:hypothetical protein
MRIFQTVTGRRQFERPSDSCCDLKCAQGVSSDLREVLIVTGRLQIKAMLMANVFMPLALSLRKPFRLTELMQVTGLSGSLKCFQDNTAQINMDFPGAVYINCAKTQNRARSVKEIINIQRSGHICQPHPADLHNLSIPKGTRSSTKARKHC